MIPLKIALPYGAENQAEIHYAMPVKNNLYDTLEYAGQVEEAAKLHSKEMKRKKEQGETVKEWPELSFSDGISQHSKQLFFLLCAKNHGK